MKNFLKNTPALLALALMATALLLGGCYRKHIVSSPPAKRPATQPAPMRPVEPAPAPADTPEEITQQSVDSGVIDETYEVEAVDEKPLPKVEESDLGEDMSATPKEDTTMKQSSEPTAEIPANAEPATEMAQPAKAGEEAAATIAEEPAPAPKAIETAEPMTESPKTPETSAASGTTAGTTAAAAPPAAQQAVESQPFIDPEKEVVEVDDGPAFMTAPGAMHYVQVGAFSKSANAEQVLADVLNKGYEGSEITMTSKGLYLVRAGVFKDEAAARTALEKLKEDFPGSYIVKWDPAAK